MNNSINKLILCEGKTDAILISYYLNKVANWTNENVKPPKNLTIKADEKKGEYAYWYGKENEKLLICAVGGKDKFKSFFNEKISSSIINADSFDKIAIIIDRDNRSENEIIKYMTSILAPIIKKIENNKWIINGYKNAYSKDSSIEFLLVIIPTKGEGALETVLLKSISENKDDKKIVDKSIEFVNEIQPLASKYLSTKRLILKSYLGVTWAIQSPEKVFSYIDEQIKDVKWEDSKILDECFNELIKI